MTTADLVREILTNPDIDAKAIYEAYRERAKRDRSTQAFTNRVTLGPGAAVRIISIRPAFLKGLTGVVEPGARGQRIRVRLDKPELARHYDRAGCLDVPATCVEAVA